MTGLLGRRPSPWDTAAGLRGSDGGRRDRGCWVADPHPGYCGQGHGGSDSVHMKLCSLHEHRVLDSRGIDAVEARGTR